MARLLDGIEAPTSPGLTCHDDLHGEFHAELDISFDLFVGLGFEPVDPSHPAYPLYLAASASREPASASPEPVRGVDPHSINVVVVPFETTVAINEAMALRYGLVAPGPATGGHRSDAAPPQPVRHKLAPPPHHARTGSGGASPPPFGNFGAFLDFLGNPGRDEAGGAADANPSSALGR